MWNWETWTTFVWAEDERSLRAQAQACNDLVGCMRKEERYEELWAYFVLFCVSMSAYILVSALVSLDCLKQEWTITTNLPVEHHMVKLQTELALHRTLDFVKDVWVCIMDIHLMTRVFHGDGLGSSIGYKNMRESTNILRI